MRAKTHMAAIRAVDGVLVLHTLRWHDEVREATVPGLGAEFSEAELDMASQLVASMTGKFDPTAHVDTYTERLNELIEAKAEGVDLDITEADAGDPSDVSDLLAGFVDLRARSHLQQAARIGGGDNLRLGALRVAHFSCQQVERSLCFGDVVNARGAAA